MGVIGLSARATKANSVGVYNKDVSCAQIAKLVLANGLPSRDPNDTKATTSSITGIFLVDAMSVFYPHFRGAGERDQQPSIAEWVTVLTPVIESLIDKFGAEHTYIFHVDGQNGDSGIKTVHKGRAQQVLHWTGVVLRCILKRRKGKRWRHLMRYVHLFVSH
ncbi:hypothetical protein BC831DRAFT_133203 [Entophlyctis helioformis]|nr:hypothetical protein BC831DRAFT_133203 [Entophlyctis helioformis]